jgi:hypothetical protein
MELDNRKFLKRLTEYERRARDALYDAMNDNRLDLEKHATLLAPIDKGTLQRSKVTDKPKWRGDILEAGAGFSTPYASKVHETMKPAIASPQMYPGPTTKAKPPTRFGPAGGKYLERPLLGSMKRYTKHIADKVKAVK